MNKAKREIFVYADWKELGGPQLMGKLTAQFGKSKKTFGFKYNDDWLKSDYSKVIDPDRF